MKKLFFLIFGSLLFISGCSTPNNITQTQLIEGGYVLTNGGNYVNEVTDNSQVYITMGEFDEVVGIGVKVIQSNNQEVQLNYSFTENKWDAGVYDGNMVTYVSPNDAYSYLGENAPEAINELSILIDTSNISTRALKDGNIWMIEDLLNYNLEISNVVFIESTYTNPVLLEGKTNNEYFLQVNFNPKNTGSNSINLNELTLNICYTFDGEEQCQENISAMAPGDIVITDQFLDVGDTMSIQMTTTVPGSATDFYVYVSSIERNIYEVSSSVNLTH